LKFNTPYFLLSASCLLTAKEEKQSPISSRSIKIKSTFYRPKC